MSWILIAIIAYLLFALNGVANKFLLTNAVRDPGVFVFYTGTASIVVLLLAPFGLHVLTGTTLLIALIAGACFAFALYFFYSAIQQTSISRILPIEGGLVPVFSLVLAYLLNLETFDTRELSAFAFLVAGSILMALKKTEDGWHFRALRHATIAAFLFALSFILTKYTYNQTNFFSGLIWTRMGLVLGAGLMLLSYQTRMHIFSAPKEATKRNKVLFYSSSLAGSLGSLLQNYAISIGSVVIVNALQGVQFAFLLILSVFLSEFYPHIIKEEINRSILIQKIAGIVLISVGLWRL